MSTHCALSDLNNKLSASGGEALKNLWLLRQYKHSISNLVSCSAAELSLNWRWDFIPMQNIILYLNEKRNKNLSYKYYYLCVYIVRWYWYCVCMHTVPFFLSILRVESAATRKRNSKLFRHFVLWFRQRASFLSIIFRSALCFGYDFSCS